MPRRNRNADAPAISTDDLADQAEWLDAELLRNTEAVTTNDRN